MKAAINLKVLQATAWYPPFHLGGTEVYLENLVSELRASNVESSVITPRSDGATEIYTHAGAAVETYPTNETPAPNEMKRGRPHFGFEAFRECLHKHSGAIYHQHSWSRGCGPHHLSSAREMGFKTVLTVHVPGNICLRGTMLRFGVEPCEGRIDDKVCGACWAARRGMPKEIAKATAKLPLTAAKLARLAPSRLATALSARALGAEKQAQLQGMAENADRIVATCRWLADALMTNGIPAEKLTISRQAVSAEYLRATRLARRESSDDAPLKLLYLGRWDPVKGIDVVVRAIRSLPDHTKAQLTIHAIPSGPEERTYEARVRSLAGSDRRISFEAAVPRDLLASVMSQHDALVVPSLWLETGPLVVLEAQAAGVYVLGSRLGGIQELIEEHGGGELVEAGNVGAWLQAIGKVARERPLSNVSREVRTMSNVAAEMAELYRSL